MTPIVVTNSSPSGRVKRVKGPSSSINDNGWNVTRNFNGGTDGAVTSSAGGGVSDGTQTTYTTEQVYEGALAAKMSILSGQTGFGAWGGIVGFDAPVAKGGDVWVQFYIRVPAAFQIITPNPGDNGSLKYIRIQQNNNGVGGTAGYFDLQMRSEDRTDCDYRMLKEAQPGGAFWEHFAADGTLVRDTWMRHTLHMHLDDVLAASGGTSRIRFWQDGALLVDSSTMGTINNAAHTCTGLYIFTFWNGAGAPQNQHVYVDDIRISSSTVPAWATGLEGV
jgi:hypothetical protein